MSSAKKSAAEPQQTSALGLDQIGDLSGLLQGLTKTTAGAGPLLLDLSLIDEDPDQPRKSDNPGFSTASLEELAETVRRRGIKTPISVRPNPAMEGHYIINHGARRFRASKLAEKTNIPAFVDPDYNEADQVIENLQRDGLTPREIADYIGRQIAAGKKKGDVAKEIGKSAAYVTQHVTLLDLPDPVASAFNTGRCADVTVVNELVTAYKKAPEVVEIFLADENQDITRGSVKLLREFIEDKKQPATRDIEDAGNDDPATEDDGDTGEKEKKPGNPTKLKKAIVQVKHDDRLARLLLNRRPSNDGAAWIKYDDDGAEIEADLIQVQLVSLLEG